MTGAFAAWIVEDALGEVYAVRYSPADVARAIEDAEEYLDGAVTCGHPDGPGWVAKRLPFVVEFTDDRDRYEELLADGVPVLEREP